MILEIIIYGIGEIINAFGSFFPGYGEVPLKLPWGIDEIVVLGVNGYKVLANSFPPFEVAMQVFLIYIGFKIVLQLLKAVPILGRTLR